MRRISLLGVVMALLFVTASPALADQPIQFSDVVVFEDLNPCSGETHEITREFTVTVHEHQNNVVLQVDSTVTMDDGFSGTGHETAVLTKNNELATLNFVVSNPETGEKFTVKGNFKYNGAKDELVVDRFTFNCVIDN